MYQKSIRKALISIDGLEMIEVVGKFVHREANWATYFRGLIPINAIWVTLDIQVIGASIMLAGFGIGDYHLFMVDFLSSSLLGLAPKKIMQLQVRRLNCKLPLLVEKYNKHMEKKILCHWQIEWTGRVYTAGLPSEETKKRLDKINTESKQYMKYTKKKCQRIKSGFHPFHQSQQNGPIVCRYTTPCWVFYKVGDATEENSAVLLIGPVSCNHFHSLKWILWPR